MTLGKSSLNSRSSPIIIGLCGATGQMGQVIIQRIKKVSICQLSSTFSKENNIREIDEFCRNSEIIIDFSNKNILDTLLESALKYKNKLVIGTTGLSDKQIDLIRYISKDLPILYSPNMSLGANLLALLAEKASQILDKNYDIEILDYHHRFKNDAPSGTAIMLAEILAKNRNLNFSECTVFSRNQRGKRSSDEIGIASIRGGKVHGEHEVLFLGDNQVFSLKHTALSRESFADGAIQAAIWIHGKKNGLYSMRDIFSI